MIITGISFVGAVLSPVIIKIVYGDRYADATNLCIIFWIVNAFNAAIRMIPMNFLPAIGVAKFNAVMAAVSCILHLVVTYFSIIKLGIWGVGIATGGVYLISGLIYWFYLWKKCQE